MQLSEVGRVRKLVNARLIVSEMVFEWVPCHRIRGYAFWWWKRWAIRNSAWIKFGFGLSGLARLGRSRLWSALTHPGSTLTPLKVVWFHISMLGLPDNSFPKPSSRSRNQTVVAIKACSCKADPQGAISSRPVTRSRLKKAYKWWDELILKGVNPQAEYRSTLQHQTTSQTIESPIESSNTYITMSSHTSTSGLGSSSYAESNASEFTLVDGYKTSRHTSENTKPSIKTKLKNKLGMSYDPKNPGLRTPEEASKTWEARCSEYFHCHNLNISNSCSDANVNFSL